MQVNIEELVKTAGLDEPLYPGKKLVKKYSQPGEYKSHSVVFDWRDSDLVKIDLKAGVSGKDMDLSDIKNYPVSFQAPTYLKVAINNDNTEDDEDDEDDEEDEEGARGKGGSGGRKPSEEKLEETDVSSMNAFDRVSEGEIPGLGEIKEFVVMGKELAQEAFATAYENLTAQLGQVKVMALDLLKGVDDVIKKATPGGGLEAKGNEQINYAYDTDKTAALFGGMSPG
jgi:hypothetical protein